MVYVSSTNSIPIFDSLTHPMPNGNWIHRKYDGKNSFSMLLSEMEGSNVDWALAVGMGDGIGLYNTYTYAKIVRECSDKLFPIAYIDVRSVEEHSLAELNQLLCSISKLGYVGIKVHPRFGRFLINTEILSNIVRIARDNELVVLLCTYCWDCSEFAPLNTPSAVMGLLNKTQDCNIILVHGGAVRLMEYIEIVRAYKNVLLDLSMTLCKYEGSSIDLDLYFAFSNFDRRICIGSDGPEYKSKQLRHRFEQFSKKIEIEKAQNIAYKNLFSFIPKLDRFSTS